MCSITMLHNPMGMWQQECVIMTKHAHRASNLANKDVDLVGIVDQTWSYFCGSVMLMTFKFACKSICSFSETSECESFFVKVLFTAFCPLFGRFDGQ